MYIVYSVLAIGIMIFVHELGHFLTAKAVGMYVYEFALGFGPRLISFTKGEVRYSLRAIPLGGFVSFGDSKDDDATKKYYDTPVWKRFLVTLAGSFTNVLFAFIVAFIVLWASGSQYITNRIDVVSPDTPAYTAGLQKGDVITAVNGVDVADSSEAISTAINKAAGEEMTLSVLRGEQNLEIPLKATYMEKEQRYMIGITLEVGRQSVTPGYALKSSGELVVGTIGAIGSFLKNLITKGEGANEVVSVVGAVGQMSNYGSEYGFATFMLIVVSISINLGIMNMLPIPGLDGSKLIFLIIEAIRGKPIPPEKEAIVNIVGLVLLFAVFGILIFKDIAALVKGGA